MWKRKPNKSTGIARSRGMLVVEARKRALSWDHWRAASINAFVACRLGDYMENSSISWKPYSVYVIRRNGAREKGFLAVLEKGFPAKEFTPMQTHKIVGWGHSRGLSCLPRRLQYSCATYSLRRNSYRNFRRQPIKLHFTSEVRYRKLQLLHIPQMETIW